MTQTPRGSRSHSSPSAETHPEHSSASRRFVVDRIEGSIAVVEDQDANGVAVHVETAVLPRGCGVEGAVLVVPIEAGGAPHWNAAVRDHREENRRRESSGRLLNRLNQDDDGGNLSL